MLSKLFLNVLQTSLPNKYITEYFSNGSNCFHSFYNFEKLFHPNVSFTIHIPTYKTKICKPSFLHFVSEMLWGGIDASKFSNHCKQKWDITSNFRFAIENIHSSVCDVALYWSMPRRGEKHSHKDLWISHPSEAELPFSSSKTPARSTSQVSSDGLTGWIFNSNESSVRKLRSTSLAKSKTWMKPVEFAKDRPELLISCALNISPCWESRVSFLPGV